MNFTIDTLFNITCLLRYLICFVIQLLWWGIILFPRRFLRYVCFDDGFMLKIIKRYIYCVSFLSHPPIFFLLSLALIHEIKMCDFICVENIKSLIDHIVTKHLSKSTTATTTSIANSDDSNGDPTLEDIANPHVETFKQLRKAYEDNNKLDQGGGGGGGLFLHGVGNVNSNGGGDINMNGNHDGLLINGRGRSILNKKALEDQVRVALLYIIFVKTSSYLSSQFFDFLFSTMNSMQRKFRQADEDDSYFNDDDDEMTEVVGAPATAATATPLEQNISTSEDVASLIDDVKSLDK